jgi:UDP-N-acetylglucosamine/UDP-N-acetylgalactosamine diphosphorylase
MGAYGDIARIVANNLTYLGNLHALLQWYHEVRSAFMRIDPFETACCKGAERAIRLMIHERVARMTELAEKMPRSLEIAQKRATERPYRLQKDLIKKWPGLADKIETDSFVGIRGKERDRFLHALDARDRNASYLTTMKAIPAFAKANGSAWLQSVVDSVTGLW